MRERERNRLIELLGNDNCSDPILCNPKCKYSHLDNCYDVRMADYLLSYVIVPRCWIGEEIYVFDFKTNKIVSYTVENINLSSDYITYQAYYTDDYAATDPITFDDDDIGNLVFLSKEEAEKHNN